MSEYIKEREKISNLFNSEYHIQDFESIALHVFRFQLKYNEVYARFCNYLKVDAAKISDVTKIPFLPIQFFKRFQIKTGVWDAEVVFESSGTTGQARSKHFIKSTSHYYMNCIKAFENVYGKVSELCILAILPGYQARSNSSLVYMVNELIKKSDYQESGFYLDREDDLIEVLEANKMNGIPTILFGVSFALLDLCKYKIDFPGLIVIETGGMKTSKLDLTKEEIVEKLRSDWNIDRIDSEYGMTELLSQAYSRNQEFYIPASTLKVIIGQISDPFNTERPMKTGLIKAIDLANYDSCSFIATEDLGIASQDGHFKVLGRLDQSEFRGCNMLLEDYK